MNREVRRRAMMLAAAGLLAAAGFMAGCDHSSDPVAPEGSTIEVTANPQTVVVPSGGGGGTTIITATVRFNGTRLPNQEVTFSSTSGILDPFAQTPLTTDDQGRATSILTTSSSATVDATSGGISGSTQVQTAPGDLSTFLLTVTPQTLSSCQDVLTLVATVVTTTGAPVPSVIVIFDEVSPSTLVGDFTPGSQVLTDANGMATVTWRASASVCSSKCQAATADPNSPSPGICFLFFTARDTTGAFESIDVEINDAIP